ncbi:MAG: CAP domain-containing protein [Sulfurovum sp.]|uniref:CAP domain-containing protein n=1 Tax=Sulfurovum sp. TaxID=1969726 RepID=UPI002867E850|nr:CAP domain-containing protein [Sulfurovum sp.]MCO4846062.1 CAP domain-containing protein [Sulfurovum sp.]
MNFIKRYMGFLLFIVFLSGCSSHNGYKQSSMVPKACNAPEINSQLKQTYLNAINQVRVQGRDCGSAGNFSSAPALRWSNSLYKAAHEHSNDMLQSNCFSHIGSQKDTDWTASVQNLDKGSSFRERIENNGYKQWKKIAENIAMGSPTLDMVMSQWLDSDKHCANIMNPDFTDVGMASVNLEGPQLSYYWTQTFAAHQ